MKTNRLLAKLPRNPFKINFCGKSAIFPPLFLIPAKNFQWPFHKHCQPDDMRPGGPSRAVCPKGAPCLVAEYPALTLRYHPPLVHGLLVQVRC